MYLAKRTYLIFLILLLAGVSNLYAQEIKFELDAPARAVVGEAVRATYVLTDAYSPEIVLPEKIKGFEILSGPMISSKIFTDTKSKRRIRNTYYGFILKALTAGKHLLPQAKITIDGKVYTSKPMEIELISPQQNVKDAQKELDQKIKESGAFVKAVVEKVKIEDREAFEVTLRLYMHTPAKGYKVLEYPTFHDFRIIQTRAYPVSLERGAYQGENYYTANLRTYLLLPELSGKIEISGGSIEVMYEMSLGQVEQTFFGPVMKVINKTSVVTFEPFTIDAGLVGDWRLAYMSSSTQFSDTSQCQYLYQ